MCFVSIIRLSRHLVSCIAVITRLYWINCWLSIIIDPVLYNVLTFHDPINVSVLHCLIRLRFSERNRGFHWVFSTVLFLQSGDVSPTSNPHPFPGLGTARNQQLRPRRSLSIVTALFISFFEGGMFSRRIVTNSTSAHGTLHYRKTRIPCGNQLVICGQYKIISFPSLS
jgi:hypothetical protein